MSKKQTVTEWRINIATKNAWAVRALMYIFELQLPEEQHTGQVSSSNKVGFNKFDSEILTELAWTWKRTGRLTHNQLEVIKKRMPKYAEQIYRTKRHD